MDRVGAVSLDVFGSRTDVGCEHPHKHVVTVKLRARLRSGYFEPDLNPPPVEHSKHAADEAQNVVSNQSSLVAGLTDRQIGKPARDLDRGSPGRRREANVPQVAVCDRIALQAKRSAQLDDVCVGGTNLRDGVVRPAVSSTDQLR